MKIIVYHAAYGCDTGCCGHIVARGDVKRTEFQFTHPRFLEDDREFAERLVLETFGAEHVVDLDWENCVVVDD